MKQVRQLVTLFAPSSYKLMLDITNRTQRVFSGTETLMGMLHKAADEIVLHSKGLTITEATIDGKPATFKAGENDELAVTNGEKLTAGEHTLTFSFAGNITDPMNGLYPCYFEHDGQSKELLMTQLESHYAREVFPCVDEPAAKATFDLTLITEPGITVLANTPVANSQEVDDTLVTTFTQTPRMSSYLLAFVVGELQYTEMINKNGVLVRCYATPDNVEHTKFALEFGAKVLEFYDDYFDLPYPLPKCDMVAVPDFASGAMENWGIITYREAALLYDEKNSSADTKEWVAAVVAHELAHQWFGNLVTMKWWDDLWLNESFAKWMEHYAVDKLIPEWRVWESFGANEQQGAFNRDSLAQVQSVREPVKHPEELHSLFDPAIVYAKGACLIRMLQNYVGEGAFCDGLRTYMKKHQYNNADADDLWEALDASAKKDVGGFMRAWLTQPGHPVVDVIANGDTVTLRQKRFYSNPAVAKDDAVLWPIPLLSKALTAETLDKAELQTTGTQPAMINDGLVGFYHTHYDAQTLQQIAKTIEQLNVVNRQGLLVDSIALARAGIQTTADVANLLAAYKNEAAYPVWQAMHSALGALRTIVNDDAEVKPHLQKYTAALAQAQFQRLGMQRVEGEPYFDQLLRPSIIAQMAYAEVPAVIDELLAQFDAANKPEDISLPELRSLVYVIAVRHRGRTAYDKLLDWYKHTISADERINLIAGLTDMRDPQLAAEMTELFTSKFVKLQDLAYWFIYSIRNRHARPATWQWMVNNWSWIKEKFDNSHDYADFPKYSASGLMTREELEAYRSFFTPKLNEATIAMVIRQGIEEVSARVAWRERDFAAIADFLKKT